MIARRVNPSLTFHSPFSCCPALYDFQLRRCVLQTFLDFDSTERLLDAVVSGGLKTFVQLLEKFWRRFGASLNEKSAQLVVSQLVTLTLAEREGHGLTLYRILFCIDFLILCLFG